MLNDTDIHILVGLLTVASSPEAVEVELGSMVYDEEAEEDRDVDVTVKYTRPDGIITACKGFEVKAHKRPLDVTHVEQLCAKLEDMPGITHRGIVSASGYTNPAKLKAAGRGIELFHIRPWTDLLHGSSFVRFTPPMDGWERNLDWEGSPSVRIDFPERLTPQEETEFTRDAPLLVAPQPTVVRLRRARRWAVSLGAGASAPVCAALSIGPAVDGLSTAP